MVKRKSASLLFCHTTYKIMANILYVKLVPYAQEVIENTKEASKGKTTVNQIFTMRQILEKCWEKNTDIPNLFIDFQEAFDTVW